MDIVKFFIDYCSKYDNGYCEYCDSDCECECDCDEPNSEKDCMIRVALHAGASHGHLHIVQYITDIYPDYLNDDGDLMQDCACNSHLHIVQYLMEKGCYGGYKIYETFEICILNNDLPAVKYLYENNKVLHEYININKLINKCNNKEIIEYLKSLKN